MSGSGVPCRAQDGGLQQLLDRIQTVRIRRRIGDLDFAAFDGKSFGMLNRPIGRISRPLLMVWTDSAKIIEGCKKARLLSTRTWAW